MKKSFYDWCLENKKENWIQLWDNEKNEVAPQEVSYGSARKIYFRCPCGKHSSEEKSINSITNQGCLSCTPCNSFGQYLINTYGDLSFWSSANEVDPFSLLVNSTKKIKLICKDCGMEKVISCGQFYKRKTLSCRCGDGTSYPNKIIEEVLKQVHIEFVAEKVFDWSASKRYDFYIPSLKCIIEVHGIQHYEESTRGRSLQAEQENDKLKRRLALENGIEHYIELDCRVSSIDWIRESILGSNLPIIIKNFNIDWVECEKNSLKNRVKEVCMLWNTNQFNFATDLAKYCKLDPSTVRDYLYKGNKYKWCNYDGKLKMRENGQRNHII